MRHDLKIYPQYYALVVDKLKTFEVRKNDRGFQYGDTVVLREWDPDGGSVIRGQYTKSPALTFKIGYVLPIDEERVVFSLLREEE